MNLVVGEVVVVLDTLAMVSLSTLALDIVDRPHDTHMCMSLRDMTLADLTRRQGDMAALLTISEVQPQASVTELPHGDSASASGGALSVTLTDVKITSPELMTVHGGQMQTVALRLGQVAVRVDVVVFLPFLLYVVETFMPDGSPLASVVNAAPLNLLDGIIAERIPEGNNDPTRLIKLHLSAALGGTASTERARRMLGRRVGPADACAMRGGPGMATWQAPRRGR